MNELQSRQLDQILKYLITIENSTNIEEINKVLFPSVSYDDCMALFYILKGYNPRLLYPEGDIYEDVFWANDYAKIFLKKGGFSQIYDNEFKKIKNQEEKESLNLEKLKYDVKNAKRIYKTYWITFAFATIALLISLYNLIFDK